MGWNDACFIRLSRRQNTDAEGEEKTHTEHQEGGGEEYQRFSSSGSFQNTWVLYMVLYMLEYQESSLYCVLQKNHTQRYASRKEITRSAEFRLVPLHAPSMAPILKVALGDLVKEIFRSGSIGQHRRQERTHAFLHQRQMLEIVVLRTEESGVRRAGQEPAEKGKCDTRDDRQNSLSA